MHIPKHVSPWSLIERSNRATIVSQRASDRADQTVAPQMPLMPLLDDDDDDDGTDDDMMAGSGNYSSTPLRFSADPSLSQSTDEIVAASRDAASGSVLGVCALQAKVTGAPLPRLPCSRISMRHAEPVELHSYIANIAGVVV